VLFSGPALRTVYHVSSQYILLLHTILTPLFEECYHAFLFRQWSESSGQTIYFVEYVAVFWLPPQNFADLLPTMKYEGLGIQWWSMTESETSLSTHAVHTAELPITVLPRKLSKDSLRVMRCPKSIACTYDIHMSARNEWVSVCSCEGERAKHEAKIKLANAHCSTYIIRFCIPVILLALKLQKLRQCLVYVNGHWILRWSLMVPMRRNER